MRLRLTGTPEQQALAASLEEVAPGLEVNLTVQGGGQDLVVMLHAPSGETIWEDAGTPTNIVARFAAWCESRRGTGGEVM